MDDVIVWFGKSLWLICCKLIQIIFFFIKIYCFLLKEHDENWWDSDVHNVIKFQFTQITKHINKSVYLNILHYNEAVNEVHLSTETTLFESRLFSKLHDSFLIKFVSKKLHCWPLHTLLNIKVSFTRNVTKGYGMAFGNNCLDQLYYLLRTFCCIRCFKYWVLIKNFRENYMFRHIVKMKPLIELVVIYST